MSAVFSLIIKGEETDIPLFAVSPEQSGNYPLVILYMDVFGPREELFDMCRRFAGAGFIAVLPNLFSRLGSPVFEPVNEHGKPLDPACIKANDETSLDMSLADTRSIVAAAKSGVFGVQPTGFFAIGYCMGGRHALSAVARCDDIQAGISAHGGRMVDATSNSPHRLIASLRKPFHFYHATDDPTCPDDHQEIITIEARKAGPHVVSERLPAHHGWSFRERWAFDKSASDLVFEQACSLFGGNAG